MCVNVYKAVIGNERWHKTKMNETDDKMVRPHVNYIIAQSFLPSITNNHIYLFVSPTQLMTMKIFRRWRRCRHFRWEKFLSHFKCAIFAILFVCQSFEPNWAHAMLTAMAVAAAAVEWCATYLQLAVGCRRAGYCHREFESKNFKVISFGEPVAPLNNFPFSNGRLVWALSAMCVCVCECVVDATWSAWAQN